LGPRLTHDQAVKVRLDLDAHRQLLQQADDMHDPLLRQIAEGEDHLLHLAPLHHGPQLVETTPDMQVTMLETVLLALDAEKADDAITQRRELPDLVGQLLRLGVVADDQGVALADPRAHEAALDRMQNEPSAADAEQHQR